MKGMCKLVSICLRSQARNDCSRRMKAGLQFKFLGPEKVYINTDIFSRGKLRLQ